MKQLKLGVAMFMVRTTIVRFMIRVRMDDRYPVDNMNVSKRNNTSQIGYEQRRGVISSDIFLNLSISFSLDRKYSNITDQKRYAVQKLPICRYFPQSSTPRTRSSKAERAALAPSPIEIMICLKGTVETSPAA